MTQLTGGELVAKMLKAEGVDVVFGIIDGTYFGFYSQLEANGIRLIGPRHEASALHMAGAYARATGRLGVAMASNGPGVANAISGVAVEQGEGHRVLLITSARRTGISYPERGGTFQYFDQVGVISPMCKSSQAAPSLERIGEMMRRAFRASWSGRPGVVHVDIPENLMNSKPALPESEVRPPHTYRRVTPLAADPELVQRAAVMLHASRRPLIHAGTGVIHAQASAELQAVAEHLGAPVVTSWGGRGSMVETHPLTIPMSALTLVQELRNNADVALVLGSRIGETDWWGKAPYWARPDSLKTIQVDVDDATLGGTRPIDLGVLADVRVFLRDLLVALQAMPPVHKQPDSWSAGLAENRAHWAKYGDRVGVPTNVAAASTRGIYDQSRGIHPRDVPRIAQEVMPADSLWCFDGGNTAVWSHFYHTVQVPNPVVTTFKFGMLGAGVGQALGQAAAFPDRRVCCLIGDGAMGFHSQEVETAVRNGLPVIYIVFNDKQWGMVKMNQQFALRPVKTLVKKALDADETINADLGPIAWDELARAMGAHGEHVSTVSELAPAIQRALASGMPAVIQVDVDPVMHMWAPALAAFKDMHGEPKG